VERIGKGKARKRYEFGVKVGIAVTQKQGLTGCPKTPENHVCHIIYKWQYKIIPYKTVHCVWYHKA
jgi:hypothetical protein